MLGMNVLDGETYSGLGVDLGLAESKEAHAQRLFNIEAQRPAMQQGVGGAVNH